MLVVLDRSATFYTVFHGILVDHLSSIGFAKVVLPRLKFFLENGSQKRLLEDNCPTFCPLIYGVLRATKSNQAFF